MKLYCTLFCLLGFFVMAGPVQASTLYGSTAAGGSGELYILNPATGGTVQDVGPLNDSLGANYAVTGIAFNPADGVLYGSTAGKTGTKLLIINPATALVTVVGSFGAGGATMTDLAFDQSGHLYGIGSSGGPTLYSINLSTGQATAIGSSGMQPITTGGGLAISPAGIFYGTPVATEFGTYNPTTGAYTHIATPAEPAGSGASYAALAFDGNTLYGLNLGNPPHLVTMDLAGTVTDIGTTELRMDGIAFVPPPPALTIQLQTNNVIIRWPAIPAGFQLQQNSDLNAGSWVPNTDPITTTNGTNQVSASSRAGNMFFRLRKP